VSTEAAEKAVAEATRRKHPHAARRADILADHPEVADLFGGNPMSALYTAALVALQLWMSVAVTRWCPAWVAAGVCYCVGAVIDHALFVLIHDATHNLVFRSVVGNRLVLLLANVPHVFPSSMSFRYYHILHHIELNKPFDPDHPFPIEARLVGNSPLRKSLWLAFFFVVQGLRTAFYTYRVPKVNDLLWMATNFAVNAAVIAAVYAAHGAAPVVYLLGSVICSIGLHPLGARWIQEHYPTQPFQATYSYYGVANLLAFNIGFHVEHHDFPSVAWNRLPELKRIAAPYYDTLFSYHSYSELLKDFIFERKWNLVDRIAVEQEYADAVAAGAGDTTDAFTHKEFIKTQK
jgi:sphingolipid 4-desaturase/C4-monooxygenase